MTVFDVAHIHPMLVHFPIVLLMCAVAIDAVVLLRGGDLAGDHGTQKITWVRMKGGKLAQAVVAIDKISGGSKPWPKTASASQSNRKGCAFLPYLNVIKNGSELTVLHSDPVLHNIHTYEIIGCAKRTMFNVSQPGKGFEFSCTAGASSPATRAIRQP